MIRKSSPSGGGGSKRSEETEGLTSDTASAAGPLHREGAVPLPRRGRTNYCGVWDRTPWVSGT